MTRSDRTFEVGDLIIDHITRDAPTLYLVLYVSKGTFFTLCKLLRSDGKMIHNRVLYHNDPDLEVIVAS